MRAWVLLVAACLVPLSASAQVDEISPAAITWHGQTAVKDWPITAKLDGMEWRPGAGLIPRYGPHALDAWPNGTPPGWEGPLQFTLWACVPISGRYHCGGFMLFWRGREGTGAHWLEPAPDGPQKGLNNWQANWADARSATAYPPMSSYVPREGDEVAFMLAAGGNRVGEVFTVAARTQLIKVKVRMSGVEWAAGGPVSGNPPPDPRPNPQPQPQPNPVPTGQDVKAELGALLSMLTELSGQLERIAAQQDAKFEAARHQRQVDTDRVLQALQSRPIGSADPVPLPDIRRTIEEVLKSQGGIGAGGVVLEILKLSGSIVGALAAAGVFR